MRNLILTLVLMTVTSAGFSQSGKAKTEKKTFSRTTTVSTLIDADEAIIWALLTNAGDFARWNSTIISIDGSIAQGEKIALKSKLDSTRTFKLKVKEMIPEKKMVWSDMMGERVYTLAKQPAGNVLFMMTEKIGGLMFPLFANKIPSFDDSFEQFAQDLKNEAELIHQKAN